MDEVNVNDTVAAKNVPAETQPAHCTSSRTARFRCSIKAELPAESVVGDQAAVRPGAPAAYGQTSAG
jgi:hypothetical protein